MRDANANTKANDRTTAYHPAKARPTPLHGAKTQPNSEKAVTQKKRGFRARSEKNAIEQVHENRDESGDVNTEPEGEEDEWESEEEEEEEEEEEGEDDEEKEEDVGGKMQPRRMQERKMPERIWTRGKT